MSKYIHRRNIKFKNEIAASDKEDILGVAIDTAKAFHRVIIFNFFGKLIVKPFSINTLLDGYCELRRQIAIAERKAGAQKIFIALETPAKYTENLVYHLEKDFKQVVFVPPFDVAQNRGQRTFRGLKTDEIDCGSVGDLLIRGEFIQPKKEKRIYAHLKNLVYWREQKIIMRSMIKNQLHDRFEKIFPGINCEYGGKKKLFSKAYTSYLHVGLLNLNKTPRAIAMLSDADLIEYFDYGQHPKGRYYVRLLKARLNEMLLPNNEVTKMELDFLQKDLGLLKIFDKEILNVENEILQLGSQTPAQYLFNQIKGVSNLAACLYIGVIGDIKKYKSAGHIYSYAGLSPQRRQSGNTKIERIGIKRAGNSLLRCLLFRMANQVVICEPFFNRYYKKHRKEKNKSWKETTIIISRKLNNIFYALMRDKTSFQVKAAGNSS